MVTPVLPIFFFFDLDSMENSQTWTQMLFHRAHVVIRNVGPGHFITTQPMCGMMLVSPFLELVSHKTGLFLYASTSVVFITPFKRSRVSSETQDKLLDVCPVKSSSMHLLYIGRE